MNAHGGRAWIPPSFDGGATVADAGDEAARLQALGRYLHERAPAQLRGLSADDLRAAWNATIRAFADPDSPQRRALDPRLLVTSRLSQGCLDASLKALLAGFVDTAVASVIDRAEPLRAAAPALLILSSNLPGLALQPLLAALALRRPLLIKCGSGETDFTPAFIADLAARQRAIGDGIAVVSWRGGDDRMESDLLRWPKVLAFGGATAIGDLERRLGGRLLAFGPKASLAIVADRGLSTLDEAAAAVARDIALFDQRGCLSVQAVYTDGDGNELAAAVAAALQRLADDWPLEMELDELAMLRQWRHEVEAAGATVLDLPLRSGSVVLDPKLRFRLSPGFRSVRVHPLPDFRSLPGILAAERGRLQGVSLVGDVDPWLRGALVALGVSRFAACGDLQSAPADWHNDGIDLVAALSD